MIEGQNSPDPNYFEHAYLGQYFGFPVVEGADLTVRGQTLQLKTLEGLKPVGSLLRHSQASNCDQLFLDPGSKDGVAGLANIARSGQIHIANALGSGVLENDAFMSFLPPFESTFEGILFFLLSHLQPQLRAMPNELYFQHLVCR